MYINKESDTHVKSKTVADTAASPRGSVMQKAQLFERTSSKDSSHSSSYFHQHQSINRTRSSGGRSTATTSTTNVKKQHHRHPSDRSMAPTEETTKLNDTDISISTATSVPMEGGQLPANGHGGGGTPQRQQSQSYQRQSQQESSPRQQQQQQQPPQEAVAVVTPELLVDALSGHEDGLLAIAERLMDHYEGGYDVMGEAIIDAFADVQKLFQHVVEAAHMEGAAFEASRRENERSIKDEYGYPPPGDPVPPPANGGGGPTTRHEEFIDQDVRDVLVEAMHKGTGKREAGCHMECYEIYEEACNSASALLPVDSDHRGRLQLSIARAESMSPERACAILKYAMDDVIRSGQNFRVSQNPDPSKRGDCVLKCPSMGGAAAPGAATRSTEEALASLVEEMKEVLSAPVYENSPVQDVAKRFWVALGEAQRSTEKNAEKLEHSLGKLKGDYLLSRAEWEEKINDANKTAESYKKKYEALKDQMLQNQYLDQARTRINPTSSRSPQHHHSSENPSSDSSLRRNVESHRKSSGTPSVASFGSGIAQQAKTLVGSFACYGMGAAERVTTPRGDGLWFDGESGGRGGGNVSDRSKSVPSRLKASFNYDMDEDQIHGLEPSKV